MGFSLRILLLLNYKDEASRCGMQLIEKFELEDSIKCLFHGLIMVKYLAYTYVDFVDIPPCNPVMCLGTPGLMSKL